MVDQLVLVTGAAGGRQGKTGRHVSELLLAKRVQVRALVRKIDDRSEYLRSLGAEMIQGDFLDYHSVERATQGVSTVYFAYPVQEGLLEATTIMAWADVALSRGFNQHAVNHLSKLWQALRTETRPFEVPDTILKVGDKNPKTFEEFLREHQDAFKPQSAGAGA